MADLIELPQRCTCAEVLGEDPNCALHGVATEWALENILPRDWQEMVLEQAAELEKLDPLAISLQATAEAAAHSTSELTALRERVAELEGALRPFSDKISLVGEDYDDDYYPDWSPFIPVGAYRRAHAHLLNQESDNG